MNYNFIKKHKINAKEWADQNWKESQPSRDIEETKMYKVECSNCCKVKDICKTLLKKIFGDYIGICGGNES